MDAVAASLLSVFEKKIRLEVPLFQRQYVWSEDHQWAPLWEDICRKFSEYLEGRKDAPAHFLGAMVLDQKQTPTTHVERRSIIDGQQRLTTIQIFLAALRDFCSESGCADLANECASFILNTGTMADPKTDKFKVWPTQRDRPEFADVLTAGSRAELERRHPIKRRKYARKPDPRPTMVEAYLYFHNQLREFFVGSDAEPPLKHEVALCNRLDECFLALKNALRIVVIDLSKDDDAQVIFETLNARGEPLLPADLLRNYIFLRASRQKEPPEELYSEFWCAFEDRFWREEVRQGRLNRPRSDLFIQHFLASRLTVEIPIKHLFVEYKDWIERSRPFPTVRDELKTLAEQGQAFRRLLDPQPGDVLHSLGTFLNDFEVGTAHPMLLMLLDKKLTDQQWATISTLLESYILRRAVCNLTNKNYNRIFLSITRQLRDGEATPEALAKALSSYTGDSSEWPSDTTFQAAWMTADMYGLLNPAKCNHLLRRLNATYFDTKMERIAIEGPLTVEHVMPQTWVQHWPLQDGSKGMDEHEMIFSDDDENDVKEASQVRHNAVQTIGNLTLITQPLNSFVSNSAWADKKPALMKSSLLPINAALQAVDIWDEDAIKQRSADLFNRGAKLWPGPVRGPLKTGA